MRDKNTKMDLLVELTQQQMDDITPCEQLPYECRIHWTEEVTKILKHGSLAYTYRSPQDNTYYIDGSSDGTRVVAVVHKEK